MCYCAFAGFFNALRSELQIEFETLSYTVMDAGSAETYMLETGEAPLSWFEGCVTFTSSADEQLTSGNRLFVYPNPGKAPFVLVKEENLYGKTLELSIYDSQGRMAHQETGNWQQIRQIENKLDPGLYSIKLQLKARPTSPGWWLTHFDKTFISWLLYQYLLRQANPARQW